MWEAPRDRKGVSAQLQAINTRGSSQFDHCCPREKSCRQKCKRKNNKKTKSYKIINIVLTRFVTLTYFYFCYEHLYALIWYITELFKVTLLEVFRFQSFLKRCFENIEKRPIFHILRTSMKLSIDVILSFLERLKNTALYRYDCKSFMPLLLNVYFRFPFLKLGNKMLTKETNNCHSLRETIFDEWEEHDHAFSILEKWKNKTVFLKRSGWLLIAWMFWKWRLEEISVSNIYKDLACSTAIV